MLAVRLVLIFIPLAIFIYPFFFFILILCTRVPCPLCRRGWVCTAWSVSPYVGVSLCVDARLCRVSSCTWRVGALVKIWSVVVEPLRGEDVLLVFPQLLYCSFVRVICYSFPCYVILLFL